MLALVVAVALHGALQGPSLVRDSALPLSGRRILLCSPRVEAAAQASSLLLAGIRPIWCPAVSVQPLTDCSALDDKLMRLAEYDVFVVQSTHAIDAVAERWLSLADGSLELVAAMLEASSVEIGAVGADALHFRRALGVPVSIAPIEPSARALAATLHDLGHAGPGKRILVASGQADANLGESPLELAALLEELKLVGAMAEHIRTHDVVPCTRDAIAPELSLLRDGLVDAVCVGSPEEMRALAAAAEWPSGGAMQPVIVALGDEVAAAAASIAPDADVLNLGARPANEVIVTALEAHFGAGKLLF